MKVTLSGISDHGMAQIRLIGRFVDEQRPWQGQASCPSK